MSNTSEPTRLYIPGMLSLYDREPQDLKTLGNQVEALYAWYLFIKDQGFPNEGFDALQFMMKIASQGTATPEEERRAIERLSDLMEAIEGGSTCRNQIPFELESIVDGLVSRNPKSRAVMLATKIQLALSRGNLMLNTHLHDAIRNLLKSIQEVMTPIEAEGLSRSLQEVIDQPDKIPDLKDRMFTLL